MSERWIIVPNWFPSAKGADDGLQHYSDRDPKWIKNYRRLLSKDEYLELTGHRRGILHGLWLEYAMSDGRLRENTRTISSRLALKVTTRDLEALNHAGFIEFSASRPLALSEQRASPEKETEKRREEKDLSKAVPITSYAPTAPDQSHIRNVIDISLRGDAA